MSKYVQTTQDNGGVHINSGIPNRAFYGVATAIGGNAWEKAGKIWYITLRDKLDERSDFQQAADFTFLVAGDLYGIGSTEQNAVRQGWGEVGITVGATSGGDGGTSPVQAMAPTNQAVWAACWGENNFVQSPGKNGIIVNPPTMKEHVVIHFERSGGFAGMSRPVTIDSQELPQAEADELQGILEKTDFAEAEKKSASPPAAPDRFVYHLSIEQGSEKHDLTFGDGNIPTEIRPLFQYLNGKLRTTR